MPGTETIPEADLPWRSTGHAQGPPRPHLVILWSLDEPERVGEAIPIEGRRVVGRGAGGAGDPAPRATIFRQRPGASTPMHPLESTRLSRVQLVVEATPEGHLEVENLGQSSLLLDGSPVQRCTAVPGSTLTVKNAVSFLVVTRKPTFDALRGAARVSTRFDFGGPDAHGLVGESAAVWQLRDDLAFAAAATGHVLLRGPSGVGKELAARAVHALSARASAPFLARNAATFPEGLVDAELFGNVKGYPNPGMPERRGVIGEADGATLFLDEIGELPPHLQAHLLRVLDAGGEYQRLGDPTVRRADLRIVAATNRGLDDLKHDFAARFVLRFELPGLEQRREDVPLLVRHLLSRALATRPELASQFADPNEPSRVRTAPELIEGLVRHAYSHHLRELERLVWLALSTSREGYVALTPEVLEQVRPAGAVAGAAPAVAWPSPTAEQVRDALAASGGNVTGAARALGLKNRFALYRLMKAHGIDGASNPPDEGEAG